MRHWLKRIKLELSFHLVYRMKRVGRKRAVCNRWTGRIIWVQLPLEGYLIVFDPKDEDRVKLQVVKSKIL